MTENDKDYFLRREAAELKLAEASGDTPVRSIHVTLAQEYHRKAWSGGPSIRLVPAQPRA